MGAISGGDTLTVTRFFIMDLYYRAAHERAMDCELHLVKMPTLARAHMCPTHPRRHRASARVHLGRLNDGAAFIDRRLEN